MKVTRRSSNSPRDSPDKHVCANQTTALRLRPLIITALYMGAK